MGGHTQGWMWPWRGLGTGQLDCIVLLAQETRALWVFFFSISCLHGDPSAELTSWGLLKTLVLNWFVHLQPWPSIKDSVLNHLTQRKVPSGFRLTSYWRRKTVLQICSAWGVSCHCGRDSKEVSPSTSWALTPARQSFKMGEVGELGISSKSWSPLARFAVLLKLFCCFLVEDWWMVCIFPDCLVASPRARLRFWVFLSLSRRDSFAHLDKWHMLLPKRCMFAVALVPWGSIMWSAQRRWGEKTLFKVNPMISQP